MMLKTNVLTVALLLSPWYSAAFVPAASRRPTTTSLNGNKSKGGSSVDLGTPCEDECALEKFPNLPDSIHPGVLSGQAQVDLYKHAKENGECYTWVDVKIRSRNLSMGRRVRLLECTQ